MLSPDELKIETYPPRKKGGQVVGPGPQGVRIEHLPTGTIAICQYMRSQHLNKIVAIDMILTALTHPKMK